MITNLSRGLKNLIKRIGWLYNAIISFLIWKRSLPLRIANFIFQRVIGLNRDCPWPVHFTSKVIAAEKITIHPSVQNSFAVSGGCYIQGGNGIIIEEGTIFGPGVKIVSANHVIGNLDTMQQSPPIHIHRRCWIGGNAVILPGVELSDGVVVGAGSVVTKSFPSRCIIGGVPARILRRIETGTEQRDG